MSSQCEHIIRKPIKTVRQHHPEYEYKSSSETIERCKNKKAYWKCGKCKKYYCKMHVITHTH